MKKWWIIGAIVLGIAIASFGSQDTESDEGGAASTTSTQASTDTTTETTTESDPCGEVPKAALSGLQDSLTSDGGGSLDGATAVKVEGVERSTGDERDAYVIRADLDAPGTDGTVLTWVADPDFIESGGGFVMGADDITREFSVLGAAASEGSPAAEYAADVVAASASC